MFYSREVLAHLKMEIYCEPYMHIYMIFSHLDHDELFKFTLLQLIKSGNALMGCCMGTLLDLEKAFKYVYFLLITCSLKAYNFIERS